MAGIPVVCGVSAGSSLAAALADELGLTLIGFARGDRFVVYAGRERFDDLRPEALRSNFSERT